MEVKLLKYSIIDNNVVQWIDRTKKLKEHEKDVVTTLELEWVYVESCFISDDQKYIYFYIAVEDYQHMVDVFNNSTLEIDINHKTIFKTCLKFHSEYKNLFSFDTFDRK